MEMNNFISPFDKTLKMSKEDDKNEEDEEVREVKGHRRVSQPSKPLDTEPKMLKSNSKRVRQPSIKNSSSLDKDTLKENEDFKTERQKHRKNKEMFNFILILDKPSKMNKDDDKSEEDEEVREVKSHRRVSQPTKPPDADMHRITSLPNVETLCNADKLTTRIQILHTDCVRGVGFDVLHKAFEIHSNIEDDELEPQLLNLMGKDKFDQYAGKIWQLKFCNECFEQLPHLRN